MLKIILDFNFGISGFIVFGSGTKGYHVGKELGHLFLIQALQQKY